MMFHKDTHLIAYPVFLFPLVYFQKVDGLLKTFHWSWHNPAVLKKYCSNVLSASTFVCSWKIVQETIPCWNSENTVKSETLLRLMGFLFSLWAIAHFTMKKTPIFSLAGVYCSCLWSFRLICTSSDQFVSMCCKFISTAFRHPLKHFPILEYAGSYLIFFVAPPKGFLCDVGLGFVTGSEEG